MVAFLHLEVAAVPPSFFKVAPNERGGEQLFGQSLPLEVWENKNLEQMNDLVIYHMLE